MKITKLLALDAQPASALLARAKKITLTYAERVTPPAAFTVGEESYENALTEKRALEVGDVLLDEKGHFYLVEAAEDSLLKVTGDMGLLQEAAWAFTARGIRLAEAEGGFCLVENPQFKAMIESVGLKVENIKAPFVPIPLPRPSHEGCCCGHHHHDGECCCGHHHHHEEGEECGCGHHHHHSEECSCGHHHHDGEDCECGHHHHHDKE